ncbi:unnamed protein product [Rotaria magnacalcarata]|uniref:Uncharacterized protein n=1 Tax=Rotaria magnacalcarata TaxID=392030 RepID=A0A819V4C8_9BILA|nr:unnamed protein product [Rotaria magnacalcarata]CAF4834117.1 unnamed protein product [Rotaria magnacalcarata]
MIIKCEYRHNGYERADYKTHKKHCIENPSAMNRKQTTTMQPRSNQNQAISHGIVCIPCGTSLQPIDLPNWLNHTQLCHEETKSKFENDAKQTPVAQRFPCEYCQKLYLIQQLDSHERNCAQDPADIESSRSPDDSRFVQYQSINTVHTHQGNELLDNERRHNQYHIRETTTGENILESENSARSDRS